MKKTTNSRTVFYCVLYAALFTPLLLNGQAADGDNIFNSITGPSSEPVIYNKINMNSFDLLSSNVIFSEQKNTQKLVVLPFKLLDLNPAPIIRNLKINVVQNDGISTFGVALGFDNSSPKSKRGGKYYRSFDLQNTKQLLISDFKNYCDNLCHYRDSLLKNSFRFTLGYNTSYFSIIGGDKVDLDQDGHIDNFHIIQSQNYSASLGYTFSDKTGVNASVHLVEKLSAPSEDIVRVRYLGGSFTFATRLMLLDEDYESSDAFLNSLFTPALIGGVSVEYQKAQNNLAFVEDGIIKKTVITPFLDFKISPKNQFRIGIPIQIFETMNNEVSLGPFIQWGFGLSNKNNSSIQKMRRTEKMLSAL